MANHISVPVSEIEFFDIQPSDISPLISKVQIKVCYVGEEANRNRSIITKDVAKKIAPSLRGAAIVGHYNEFVEDFEEHNRSIDISNGKFDIRDETRPYGFVPTNARVWFQWFEDDGVPHEYMVTEGYIWTGIYPETQRIVDNGNNQSMELDENSLDAFWTKDNNGQIKFFIINEAIVSKLCILGENVEPCFEGASITNLQFSLEDNFSQKLYSLMETMQEILKGGGRTPVFNTYAVEIGGHLWDAIYDYIWKNFRNIEYHVVGIYEENDGQKFAILQDCKDLTYARLNFEYTEENGFVVTEDIQKVAVDFKPVEPTQYVFAEVEAYEKAFVEKKNFESAPVVQETEKVKEPEVTVENASVESVAEKVADVGLPNAVSAEEIKVAMADSAEEASPATVKVESEPVVEETPVQYNLEDVVEYQELLQNYTALQGTVNELQQQIATLTQENESLSQFKLKVEREQKEKMLKEEFYMLSDELKKDCYDNIDKYSLDDIEAKLSVICVRNKINFASAQEDDRENLLTYNVNAVEEDDNGCPRWFKRAKEIAKEKNI